MNSRNLILIVVGLVVLVCIGMLCVLFVAGVLFFSIQRTSTGESPTYQETIIVETISPQRPTPGGRATATPVSAEGTLPAESGTPGSLNEASSDGIRFTFRPEVAASAAAETVPGETDPNAPAFAQYPEHVCFMFAGYLTENELHEPRVCVFPVEDYRSLNEHAAETIDTLEALLAGRPASPPEEELPFLPIQNAAQFLHAQVSYLDFAGGSGVRYLTQYGQGPYPIHNRGLFYTFQGLTSDGEQYVMAILPVSSPALPDLDTFELDEEFAENYPGYLEDAERTLNELSPTDFIPHLTWLDELIESIEIE